MDARELVSMLEYDNPDISRTRLLDLINFVHRLMLSDRSLFNRVTDTTTGLDPKITPDATPYDITAFDADANWIDAVYVSCYDCPLDVTIYRTSIAFKEEHIGNEYYVRYYRKPTEILDEGDELQVPDEYIDILEAGVNARIAEKEHGSRDEFLLWKRNELKPFKWALNKQYKWNGGIDGKTQVRTSYS